MAYKKGAGNRYAKALLQIKSKFSTANLFIGHFNSFNQQIAFSYLNPSKLFLIDDGLATIIYQNLYICQDKTKYNALFFRIKTYIKFLLKGVYCKFPRILHKYTNLFTSYHFLKKYIITALKISYTFAKSLLTLILYILLGNLLEFYAKIKKNFKHFKKNQIILY